MELINRPIHRLLSASRHLAEVDLLGERELEMMVHDESLKDQQSSLSKREEVPSMLSGEPSVNLVPRRQQELGSEVDQVYRDSMDATTRYYSALKHLNVMGQDH